VGGRSSIPARYEPLHKALSEVQKKASAQVNLSRLRLALQGLESDAPVARVAVLGLNVEDTARRLVRLLLADALEKEGRWEKQLLAQRDVDSSGGLLLRYGHPPNSNLPQSRTSIPVLHVPSSVLERNNIEILVSSVSGPKAGDYLQSAQTVSSDAFLSPNIGTPTAASGRQVSVRQPVHSCLLVTQGLDELMQAAELLASTKFTAVEERDAVRLAVNLQDTKDKTPGKVFVFDATKAEAGLAAIRRSVAKATDYEHKWVEAGMPALSSWLTLASAARSEEAISTPVRNLVSSLLTTATTNLQMEAGLENRSASARTLSLATQTDLESAIDEFSRNAHQELRSGLASAWQTRNWRKLAWYKLFWRVDDVGLIVNDLVASAWLPRTERAVYELSGRLSQAGITPVEALPLPPTMSSTQPVPEPSPTLQAQSALATDPPLEPVLINVTGSPAITMTPVAQPLPLSSSISQVRSSQMTQHIISLSSTAQQIVLKTLSVSGLWFGLSGLTYFSLTLESFYEAGTIAALGTAYALWRMQGDWGRATRGLETGLLEEGRDVIRRIVGRMRELLQEGARLKVDEEEVQQRREAEDAVQNAKGELKRLVEMKRK
jgi:hypothetical protein